MLQRRLILACVFVLAVALPIHAQQLRHAKAPEDVGLSSERLKRISILCRQRSIQVNSRG